MNKISLIIGYSCFHSFTKLNNPSKLRFFTDNSLTKHLNHLNEFPFHLTIINFNTWYLWVWYIILLFNTFCHVIVLPIKLRVEKGKFLCKRVASRFDTFVNVIAKSVTRTTMKSHFMNGARKKKANIEKK